MQNIRIYDDWPNYMFGTYWTASLQVLFSFFVILTTNANLKSLQSISVRGSPSQEHKLLKKGFLCHLRRVIYDRLIDTQQMSWWLTLGSPWWSTLVKSLGPSLLTGQTSDWDYYTSWGRHAAPPGLIIGSAGAKLWCQPTADPCGVFKSGQLLDGARHFSKSALLFSVSTYFWCSQVLQRSRVVVITDRQSDFGGLKHE